MNFSGALLQFLQGQTTHDILSFSRDFTKPNTYDMLIGFYQNFITEPIVQEIQTLSHLLVYIYFQKGKICIIFYGFIFIFSYFCFVF